MKSVTEWAAGIKAKRRASGGLSFRPLTEPAQGEEAPGQVHHVELKAPVDGNDSELYIDGARFDGALDVAVEFGLDKPTIVTLKFYADVVMRERQQDVAKIGDEER